MSGSPSEKVRVVLIDDHPAVRAGLRFILERSDDLIVVGEGESGHDAIRLVDQLQPDVVVMDVTMPGMSGIEATRLIKERRPETRILIVSTHNDEEYVLGALDAGTDGYLLKRCRPDELCNGVLNVHAGDRVIDQSVMRTVISKAVARPVLPASNSLSEREREVLRLLADGSTSKEIAVVLGLRPKTVENHRARILDKLCVANTAAAVRLGLAEGVVSGSGTPKSRWGYVA